MGVPELREGQGEFSLVIDTLLDLLPIKFGDGGEFAISHGGLFGVTEQGAASLAWCWR